MHDQSAQITNLWPIGSTCSGLSSAQAAEVEAAKRGDRRCAAMTLSSVITGANYWPEQKALELSFTSGRRYLYLGVTREVAEAFAAAPSKGGYFNSSIKRCFVCHELARRRAA